jgi:sugar phosphate isomerase/epimerase
MAEFLLSAFADEAGGGILDQIDALKANGLTHIEPRGLDEGNISNFTAEQAKALKKVLDEHGVGVSSIGSHFGKINIKDDFTDHFESFKQCVENANILGTPNIRMFSFYLPAENRAACRSAVFDRIGEMVRCAEENGAVLLHENEKGIYGEMAAECRQLMDTFYGNHFRAIFDFANFVQAGQDTLEAFSLLRPFIAYVHVKDALAENGTVVPPGMGDGHVADILAELAGAGFDGFLSIEPHLAHFAGFDLLEKNGVSIAKGTEPLEGFDAFELAHRSLMRLLNG